MEEQGAPASLENLVGRFRSTLAQIAAWWEINGEQVIGFLQWAVDSYPRARLLEATGWLPHYTTPQLHPDQAAADADAAIAAYYAQAWPQVEAAFVARLAGYRIDAEAKACFEEALAAHRHGLYRVAPRLLFPEIERLARSELAGVMEVQASQRALRHAASALGADNFTRTGVLSLRLFGAFADHIYAEAKGDEVLARMRQDPVPNRHAAIHGLATYNTQKTSLNALIICEFVLLTVDAVKTERFAAGTVGVEQIPDGDLQVDLGFPWSSEAERAWRPTIAGRDAPILAPDQDANPDDGLRQLAGRARRDLEALGARQGGHKSEDGGGDQESQGGETGPAGGGEQSGRGS